MEDDTRLDGSRPQSNEHVAQGDRNDSQHAHDDPNNRPPGDAATSAMNAAPQEGPPTATSPQPFASQLYMAASHQSGRIAPYNMANMAHALPQAGQATQAGYRTASFPHAGQHRHNIVSPPSSMIHQAPPMHSPYAGLPQMSPIANNQGYYIQQPHMGHYYGSNQMSPIQGQPPNSQRQPVHYYPNQMVINQHDPTLYYSQQGQFHGQTPQMPGAMLHAGQYMATSPITAEARGGNHMMDRSGNRGPRMHNGEADDGDERQGVVRGPPRKPRQNGHAIWIGNLPQQTDLMTLVHHVCREAPGLVSLFLISKSNCAFANFRDETTCAAAQQKLHDSRFQGIRLVSRLRKNTVEGAQGARAPTGPSATSPTSTRTDDSDGTLLSADIDTAISESDKPHPTTTDDRSKLRDRFFILKSLTRQDLFTSVKTGVWATQSHNEDALNSAFKTADNVYLVFSANKSGEYFGYARMVSKINDDPAAAIEFAPKIQTANDSDLPKAIPTEANEYTPRGRIMDDSARGTIFWEADRDESDRVSESGSETSSVKSGVAEEDTKTWGKPFKLEWLSTTILPFYRTRGLRNPWNTNREIKIARDGTELEPSVGRRLIGLFNRVQSPDPSMASMMPPQMGDPARYPVARPYGP